MRWLAIGVLLVGGCVSPPAPAPSPIPDLRTVPAPTPVESAKPKLPHYRCDNNIEFDVRFIDGSAELTFANREPETLLRDAGGVTPQETVYSSTDLKAHFGLEPDGRGAKLNFTAPPLESHCLRD
jgi:hypothetical protein